MNFSGHMGGGLAAGTIAVAVGITFGAIPPHGDPGGFITNLRMEPLLATAGVFSTAWLMALFPDLDTASIPQRWYFRGMLAALAFTLLLDRMEAFVTIAFLSILPVIHQHRGWTHWKITPWVIAVSLAALSEYHTSQASLFSGFSWERVLSSLKAQWIFVFACVLGHYTHLLLDSRHNKWLPFIHNSAGHH